LVSFYPKDKEIEKILDRLTKNNATYTNHTTTRDLCRFKQIRYLREKDKLFVGLDRRKGVSIIYVKKLLIKKGNGFFF